MLLRFDAADQSKAVYFLHHHLSKEFQHFSKASALYSSNEDLLYPKLLNYHCWFSSRLNTTEVLLQVSMQQQPLGYLHDT
jgi:hypothetical protein